MFFPCEKIEICSEIPLEPPCVYTRYDENDGKAYITCGAEIFSQKREYKDICETNEGELKTALLLYKIFSEICGFAPKWGVLTGVRPAKLMSILTRELGDTQKAQKDMQNRLLVSPEKTVLCQYCYEAEERAQKISKDNSFSLYISIPFCPTRCSYCSFVSHSIEKAAKLVDPYVDLLCREIEETAKITTALGLSLCTVYFGGGTPTQLSADQLKKIMLTINKCFDMSDLAEYTIEAGRPDTVTSEKLQVIKGLGCNRISINPQTMIDEMLRNIGRKHTVEQTLIAYNIARKTGFDFINMDLIAGLPGETEEGYKYSLDEVMKLNPENITVHVLSMKRSSRLVVSGEADYSADSKMVEEMLKYSDKALTDGGYTPYYLYRQSKMLGNHENVGWCKEGYDCFYNIYMMNELHTVLSVGAGGVTRLKQPGGSKIERIFNYKFPYEYIDRFQEMIDRKEGIRKFYEKYN